MNLAEFQQQVYQLIYGDDSAVLDESVSDDAQKWMAQSRADGSAPLVRSIGRWWLGFNLENGCVLSSSLLRRLNLWDEAVAKADNFSFIPDLIDAFLKNLTKHQNPMVASLARFERSMIMAKLGAEEEFEIFWETHPVELINALLENTDLPEWGCGHFQTIVSAAFPHLFKAYEIEDPSDPEDPAAD